jgi:hypothetical protein
MRKEVLSRLDGRLWRVLHRFGGLTTFRGGKKQIPSLRCGMTSRNEKQIPSLRYGMTSRNEKQIPSLRYGMTSKGGGMTSKGAGRRPGGVEGFRIMSYEL